MSELNKLIHLAHLKNEINRRRRRFYKMQAEEYSTRECKYIHKPEDIKNAGRAGYEKCKLEMKAMTPAMAKIRKDIGARLIWGGSGNIQEIRVGDKRIPSERFEAYHHLWMADSILLGDD